MSLQLTEKARIAAGLNNLTPNLVLEIDGVAEKFGAVTILKLIRIGDPGLLIDGSWVIGGSSELENQLTCVTFEGSSTTINQKLDIDKGSGASVSQMAVALVDIDERITKLITPGEVVTDILARKCTVWLGLGSTNFPDDYIRQFRGIVDQVQSLPGKITLQLSHPDQKKRQEIFIKAESQLNGAIGPSDTTINLVNASGFFDRILGPDGTYDSSIEYGIRVNDEVIFYTGITGNQLTGCTRGQLGTLANSHADQDDVDAFIRIQGNVIDLALKLMLSGWNGPYESSVTVDHFNLLGDLSSVPNSIFFQNVDVADVYGVIVGDYISTTGATNGANNVTLKQVIDVVKTGEGSYVVVDDVAFVTEPTTSALIDFRSQYDTFNPNCGMGLHNNEVDISEHERLKRFFLSSFEYDFCIRDNINAKDFLEQQIYFPAALYSLPRKSKASVGYHIGPLPGSDIITLDTSNVVNASKLNISRGINRNLYNTIIYQYEERILVEDKFARGRVTVDAGSLSQIPVGTKALVIPAKGIRSVLSGANIALSASNRRLKRYKLAAEYIEGLQVTFGSAMSVEIGDILLIDFASLKISDTKNATRNGEPRLFEVYNKSLDIRTGKPVYSVVDTAYSTATRYCLMSPSSRLDTGTTSTTLRLKVTGNSIFGNNEGRKWSRYIGATVRVRSDDFIARNDTSTIQSVSGNTLILSSALSFTPSVDDTLTLVKYVELPNDKVSERIKLIYGFTVPGAGPNFVDGSMAYQLI